MKFIDKAIYYLRFKISQRVRNKTRVSVYRLLGMRIGNDSSVGKFHVTWPHKVQIGFGARIEHDIYLKHDGIWSAGKSIIIGNNVFIGNHCEFNIRDEIRIGDDCLIASGCKFIDHDHGILLDMPMRRQAGKEAKIIIENDVWLGVNVTVLKGVRIESGAILAAGSVVTRPVPRNEIWGGVPAKKIGVRLK